MPSISAGEHTVMRSQIDHSRPSPQGYCMQMCMRIGEWTTCHARVSAVKTVIDQQPGDQNNNDEYYGDQRPKKAFSRCSCRAGIFLCC